MKEGLYVSSFKEVFLFYSGGFFCSLFWCWHLQQIRKNDNSVTAKAEASYNQTTTAFIDSIGETARQIGQDYNIYASVLIAPSYFGIKFRSVRLESSSLLQLLWY